MNRRSRFCFLEKQIYGLSVVATAFFAFAFSAFAAIVLAAFSPWADAAEASEHLPSDIALAHSTFVIDAQDVFAAQQDALAGVPLVVAAVWAFAANENAAKAAIKNIFFILNLILEIIKYLLVRWQDYKILWIYVIHWPVILYFDCQI